MFYLFCLFACRIVASLARLYPELAGAVAEVVRKDFYAQLKFAKANQPIDHRFS
jgi:hypothetical protein